MLKFSNFLPRRTETEISMEIVSAVRCAIAKVGQEQKRVIVIGQLNIQLNMAQGGGAKVEVLNK